MKYKIIRALDIAGLRVFEPVVLLCYGEEPRQQLKQIGLYIAIPILVLVLCVVAWDQLGPQIKTRAGEVPTPAQVVKAYGGIADFHRREYTKLSDYERTGPGREAAIFQANQQLAALDQTWNKISERSDELLQTLLAKIPEEAATVRTEIEQEWQQRESELSASSVTPADVARQRFRFVEQVAARFVAVSLTPMADAIDQQTALYQAEQDKRSAALEQLASKISADDYTQKVAYVQQVQQHLRQTEREAEHLKALQRELSDRREKALPEITDLAQQVTTAGQQTEFLNSRLALLKDGNRQRKVELALAEMTELKRQYALASGPEIFTLAQALIERDRRIASIAHSTFAKPPTFFDQIWTSLQCVFAGFLIATAIAIPVGVCCGMSRVFMASMTPLISLFKPVSPIVWLPIVFFIVGAFITKPDEAWIQPSFLSSAITVALCSLWPTLVNTALGVSSIDQDHLNVARVLRLGLWDRLTKIVIPSALPLIFTGLRISLGVGWMVLIAAELLSSSPGLGKFVWDMFNNGSSATFAQMFVACGFVGVIGLLLDRIMIVFQRLVSFDGAPTAL